MCAAPTSPTLISLVTEALRKAGWANPATDGNSPYTRARDEWMEEIKNEIIGGGKQLKSLETERVFALTDGLNKYAQPSDYLANKSIEIIDGTHQDTATDGASGTITFAVDEDATSVAGREIMITSGTGANQIRFCYSYNSSSKQATISPVWTAPNTTSKYMIVDTYHPIDPIVIDQPTTSILNTTSRPTYYYLKNNNTNGDIFFHITPNRNATGKVYAVKQKYYANLMELDLAGALVTTLYERWQNVWLSGLLYRALHDIDDERYKAEQKKYYELLGILIKDEVLANTIGF